MKNNSTPAEVSSRMPRDVRRLVQDGSASVSEVRDFIRQMRGKSPQEVLGSVAQSNLTSGVVLATVLTVGFMAAFTVGPYVLASRAPKKSPKPAVAEAAKQPAESKPDAAASASPATAEKTPDQKVQDALGVSEVKESDPKRNPLEDKADDLLKDIK